MSTIHSYMLRVERHKGLSTIIFKVEIYPFATSPTHVIDEVIATQITKNMQIMSQNNVQRMSLGNMKCQAQNKSSAEKQKGLSLP